MKNKHGKGARAPRPGNAAVDGQVEYSPNDRSAWLINTFDLEEATRSCQARSMASEIFLQTQLFPLAASRIQLDESRIVDLLVDFKRSRRDLDVNFEMAQVMARILSRFQCHLIDDLENSQPVLPDSLEMELNLFVSLADLNIQRIDLAVQDRLHSG